MSKVVVISGHPNLKESYTNTVILEQLETSVSNLTVRRLDALYPDYKIDVQAEQDAIIDADIIVLQFPFYWYSIPALLKKWLDDVFSYNFAYGAQGDKLKDKALLLSFTVGGPEESYTPLGYNHFSIEELIKPLQQTAYMAKMNFVKPVFTHRMVYIEGVYNKLEDVQNRAITHSQALIKAISTLTESTEQKITSFVSEWFSTFDLLPEQNEYFTSHLSDSIRLVMPEGEFIGHEGFRDWYAIARKTFKPNCDHKVEQIDITETNKGYEVALRIRLIAQSYEDSDLQGEHVNVLVNETWQLKIIDGSVIINEYLVDVLSR
ncbi:NAD(P)H-dependent oxidoreductase [Pseudoalteromonas phenolica]|uniref:NADPH-dependent FMN reductase family protein n=2 Tax=Pseudoalteromonas phenolica TaxID=161398 RepID=A0A0S2K2I2_9GAMM|nr:NAD(P)H-dependent oxidoreductase [Pseudoalteromonas phenolica]ALO42711.1 NADPH-dependent FMN reductase family protein [Pseudoalteromonas phenolica]MBE0356181.1 hypothetical protein [Pseudoalteromonas phenolica O-BC30]